MGRGQGADIFIICAIPYYILANGTNNFHYDRKCIQRYLDSKNEFRKKRAQQRPPIACERICCMIRALLELVFAIFMLLLGIGFTPLNLVCTCMKEQMTWA